MTVLIGGRNPEQGQAYYFGQARRWASVAREREALGMPVGLDARVLAAVFSAVADGQADALREVAAFLTDIAQEVEDDAPDETGHQMATC